MYRAIYERMTEETQASSRRNEHRALTRCLELLEKAQVGGRASREMIDALHFTDRLWSIFLKDLASDENGLPVALRANLISIGISMLRQTEDIRQGQVEGLEGLIDITRAIRAGLEGV